MHWDGKMLPDMKGKDKVDRLALVITAENEEKLLGIAKLEESCGENIAEGIEYLVQIVAFDTTSTNTGIEKGSAYLLESKLGRDLLFLPCRHHISELLIKAVFELNFGKTSAPEVTLFNRFSKNWKNMNINTFKSGVLDEAVQKNLTAAEIETHKNFCLEALKSHYVRADYKELLQLSLIFLGKEVPNFTQLRLPGATIHARFMSKAIYCYKIFLLREQFKMTSSELKGIRNICIFLTRIYVSYWFGCVNAVSAPRQDLQFIKDAISYFDLNVSNALLSKIKNHLWYLSEEAVALGFFDEMISIEVKRKMVEALGNHDDENDKVIPKRLNLTLEQVKSFENKDVSSFVTPRTKRFFHRLQIDVTFFELDPSIWKDQEEYCTAKRICQHLTVVNDPAERAIKLITDFNRALTYDEEDKQYLLQVVEHYRKNFSSHKKSSLV